MKRITARAKIDYYRRSFEAIDGLWFLALEAEHGFEQSLEYDRRVWEVAPKIQARQLKEALEIQQTGLPGLAEALTAKFSIEKFSCSLRTDDHGHLIFEIKRCPWYDLMKKSGRGHLAARVGAVICPTEYSVWAREFSPDIQVEISESLCDGRKTCTLDFYKARNPV